MGGETKKKSSISWFFREVKAYVGYKSSDNEHQKYFS